MKRVFIGSELKVLAVDNKETYLHLLDIHLAKVKDNMIKTYDKLPKEKLFKSK